ncbi:MAG: sulfatase-like hydrolase/transferase [Myxococcota bacterium]
MIRSVSCLLLLASCSMDFARPTSDFEPPPVVRLASSRLVPAAQDPRPVPTGPNVVMVVVSSWRADELSPWGGDPTSHPYLASIAGQSRVAQRTVAQTPSDRASTATILTGKIPASLAMIPDSGAPDERALPPAAVTLAEHLHKAGWSTIGVTANPNLNVIWGMDQGFELYFEAPVVPASVERAAKVTTQEIVAHTLTEVKSRLDPKRPLYLQIALADTHMPLEPAEASVTPFRGPGIPPRVARYRAALKAQDSGIEALMRGLKDQGIDASNTVFVWVGDHGDSLGDGQTGVLGHSEYLNPDVSFVPWIMHGSGVEVGVRPGLSAHVDVLPTTLTLAGVAVPDGLPGSAKAPERKLAYVQTTQAPSLRTAAYSDTMMCQVDHDGKATARSGARLPFTTGCCAHQTDPTCGRPEWDEDLVEAARKWPVGQAPDEGIAPVQAAMNPAEQNQLRAFGAGGTGR